MWQGHRSVSLVGVLRHIKNASSSLFHLGRFSWSSFDMSSCFNSDISQMCMVLSVKKSTRANRYIILLELPISIFQNSRALCPRWNGLFLLQKTLQTSTPSGGKLRQNMVKNELTNEVTKQWGFWYVFNSVSGIAWKRWCWPYHFLLDLELFPSLLA